MSIQESEASYAPLDDWVEAEIQDGWPRVRPGEEDAPSIIAKRVHVGATRRRKIGEITQGDRSIPIYTYARPEAVEAFDEGSGDTTFVPSSIVEDLSDHRVHPDQLPEVIIWKAPVSDPAETDIPRENVIARHRHMQAGKTYKTIPGK